MTYTKRRGDIEPWREMVMHHIGAIRKERDGVRGEPDCKTQPRLYKLMAIRNNEELKNQKRERREMVLIPGERAEHENGIDPWRESQREYEQARWWCSKWETALNGHSEVFTITMSARHRRRRH
jgi:hypothetical protein